jgi:hypothetical protein
MANSLLPAKEGKQQQGTLISYTKHVLLWHPLLAKGDTSDTFEIW